MKNLFLIVGNFGVGKTSIIKKYEHKKTKDPFFTECNGLLSLGGRLGADSIGKWFSKKEVIDSLIPSKSENDLIIHSMFYSGMNDVVSYKKSHITHVIYLKTSFENNLRRMYGRRGHVMDIKNYNAFERSAEKLMYACKNNLGVNTKTIDNNKPLEEVSNQVWGYIEGQL